jgi:hypothetical protein
MPVSVVIAFKNRLGYFCQIIFLEFVYFLVDDHYADKDGSPLIQVKTSLETGKKSNKKPNHNHNHILTTLRLA